MDVNSLLSPNPTILVPAPKKFTLPDPTFPALKRFTLPDPTFPASKRFTLPDPTFPAPKRFTLPDPTFPVSKRFTLPDPTFPAPKRFTLPDPTFLASKRFTLPDPIFATREKRGSTHNTNSDPDSYNPSINIPPLRLDPLLRSNLISSESVQLTPICLQNTHALIHNAARSSNTSTPPTSRDMSPNPPITNSRPSTDTPPHSRLCGKKRRNEAPDARPRNRRKGDSWEETAELLLGTIVIKHEDHCERECGPSPSPESSDPGVTNSSDSSVTSNSPSPLPVFSDPGVTNSSDSSVTSNSPSPLPVFSDPGVTNSTESRFTGNSQSSVITSSQSSIAVSNRPAIASGNRSSEILQSHSLQCFRTRYWIKIQRKLLIEMINDDYGWDTIAKVFKRSENVCEKRYRKITQSAHNQNQTWTDAEDTVLVNRRATYVGFEVISAEMKSHTPFECVSRYNIIQSPKRPSLPPSLVQCLTCSVNKRNSDWTEEEDQKLMSNYLPGNSFHNIAKGIEGRTRSACYHRIEHLKKKPDTKLVNIKVKKQPWRDNEKGLLLQLRSSGTNWKDILSVLPGRTVRACKSEYMRLCRVSQGGKR